MPRVIRDSDDDVETKSCIRRTRATTVANITDSPIRRNTRSTKQLPTIESEFLDDSNAQPAGPTTRSRIATLDKGMATTVLKNLRSRKNSGSSDVSETVELESDTIEKKVTRRNKAGQLATGTPIKANPRPRSVRAGSEAKSTPPISKRVTRSSSVDPISNLNDSLGTPIKRRTRASIVPSQPTVTEDEEIKNKDGKSLEFTPTKSHNDSKSPMTSDKEKSIKNIYAENNTKNDMSVKESINNSEKFTLDSRKKFEDMIYNSNTSSETVKKSANKSLLVSINNTLDSKQFDIKKFSKKKRNDTNMLLSLNQDNIVSNNSLILNNQFKLCSSKNILRENNKNDEENEHIDVEKVSESSFTDESIEVDHLEYDKIELPLNKVELSLKNSYVKLKRTNVVEKLLNKKRDESKKNNDKNYDPSNQSFTNKEIMSNVKTAIVLVDDIAKSNKNPNKQFNDTDIVSSLQNQNLITNNDDDKNLNDGNEIDKFIKVKVNEDKIDNAINTDNNDEIVNYIYINDSNEDSENSISILEHSTPPQNIPDPEFNIKIKDCISLSTHYDNDEFMNLKKDESGTSTLINKNINVENIKTRSILTKENQCSYENKKRNEINLNQNLNTNCNLSNISNHENLIINDNLDQASDVNTINDTLKKSIFVNKNRDNDQNALISTKSVKSVTIYNENDCFNEIIQNDIKLNDYTSLQIPKKLHVTPGKSLVNKVIDYPCSISIDEDIETIDLVSTHKMNNSIKQSININDKIDSTYSVIEHNEMETDQNNIETLPESNINNVDNEVTLEPTKHNISDETDTHLKQNKICGVDKISVSSAVTDADGENASTPTETEDNKEINEQDKSQKKPLKKEQKRNSLIHRSKEDDSDLDNSVENLFHDIPAEEWRAEMEQTKLSHTENENVDNIEMETDENNSSINKQDSSIRRESLDQKEARKSFDNKSNEFNDSNKLKDLKNLESKKNINEIPENEKLVLENEFSINKSLELSQPLQELSEKILPEKRSSMNESKSPEKSNRRSFNSSLHLQNASFEEKNTSSSEKLSDSRNNSKISEKQFISDTSSKSLLQQTDENSSEESIDEKNYNINKSRKMDNKSLNESEKEVSNKEVKYLALKDKSISEESSESLNNSKQSNTSLNKLLIKGLNKNDSYFNKIETVKDNNNDKNKKDGTDDKLEKKHQKSLNKSNLSNLSNQSHLEEEKFLEKSSSFCNSGKKLKNKSFDQMQSLNDSNDEIDVVDSNEHSLNTKSNIHLNESFNDKLLNKSKNKDLNLKNAVKHKNKNKLLKNNSLSKSTYEFNSDEDTSSEIHVDCQENNEKISTNKSNISTKSRKSIDSVKSDSITENTNDVAVSNFNLTENKEAKIENNKNKMILNKSIEKHNDRKKFINPVNLELFKTTQLESDSVSESSDSCGYRFRISDIESVNSSHESDFSNSNIDSDIAKEYNLSGKQIDKYSDDDVPGDECRASEEELSDDNDDGNDLTDFIVPDDEIEEDYDEIETKNINKNSDVKEKFKDSDVEENDSHSDVKEKTRDSDVEDNYTDSDVEENYKDSDIEDNYKESSSKKNNKVSDNKCDSEKIQVHHRSVNQESKNNSKLNKNESLNESNLKNNVSISNLKSMNDKSNNLSQSGKVKNNHSESRKSNTMELNLSNKNKKISKSHHSSSLCSDDEDNEIIKNVTSDKSNTISTPKSESESESEDGEDSYHIISADQSNTSRSYQFSSKAKKLAPLIECSTPKPGVIKKNDFSKGADSFVDTNNLQATDKKSNSTKRKSGSLNDLSDTKMVSSRMTIAEVESKCMNDTFVNMKESLEVADKSESIIKNRQAWKLIPLNQTAHAFSNETPITKYLKKSKLNDSAPDTERRKSSVEDLEALSEKSDSLNKKSSKKVKKAQELNDEAVNSSIDKKSKKRKLHDISNAASIDDDSSLRAVKVKNKRARIEESIAEESFKWEVEKNDSTEVQKENKKKKKKKKKKLKNKEIEESVLEVPVPDVLEDTQHIKKKKKNKSIKLDESAEQALVPDVVEDTQQIKKKKKNKHKDVSVEEAVIQSLQEPEETKKKKRKKDSKKESKKAAHAEENEQDEQEISNVKVKKHKKKKALSMDDDVDQENLNTDATISNQKLKLHSESDTKLEKSKKRKNKAYSEGEDDAPDSVSFENARRTVLTTMQREIEAIRAQKHAKRKKQRVVEPSEETGLKRLPDEVIDALTDEPVTRKSNKRQKLPNNAEREVIHPSTSMFSPGKKPPVNLMIDDGYIPLNLDGGTTEFGVVNLQKAKKFTHKHNSTSSFRERMLSRNFRQPTSMYLAYLKKQKL